MDDQLSVRAGSNVGPVSIGLELIVGAAKKVGNVPLTKVDPGPVKDYLICTGKTLRGQYFGVTVANPTGSGGDLDTVQLIYVDADGNECILGGGSVTAGAVNTIEGGSIFLVPVPEGAKIILRVTPNGGYTGGAVIISGQFCDMLETANLISEQDLGTDKRTVIPAVKGKTLTAFAITAILNMDDIPHNVDTFVNDGVSDVLAQGVTAVIPAGQVGFTDLLGFNLLALSEGYSLKMQMQEATHIKRCFFLGFLFLNDTPADEPVI